MSFQKCPVCEGSGYTGVGFLYGISCSVCGGFKIIDEVTGQAPYQIVTTTNMTIGDDCFKKMAEYNQNIFGQNKVITNEDAEFIENAKKKKD